MVRRAGITGVALGALIGLVNQDVSLGLWVAVTTFVAYVLVDRSLSKRAKR